MKAKLLAEAEGLRTYVIVMDKGDEPVSALGRWATEAKVAGAGITGIGAFRRARLGYFDRERTEYDPVELNEQAEVLSLVGDIAQSDGEPAVHAHAVLGLRDLTTRGGHLMEAEVWPTLELIVTEVPAALRKRHDPETGLALIDPHRGA